MQLQPTGPVSLYFLLSPFYLSSSVCVLSVPTAVSRATPHGHLLLRSWGPPSCSVETCLGRNGHVRCQVTRAGHGSPLLLGGGGWQPGLLHLTIRQVCLRKKVKIIKGDRNWRSISGTQTFFLASEPPPPGIGHGCH